MKRDEYQQPINNPYSTGLRVGFWRPRFYRDAPLWVTALVFGSFIAILLVAIFLR